MDQKLDGLLVYKEEGLEVLRSTCLIGANGDVSYSKLAEMNTSMWNRE